MIINETCAIIRRRR